MAGHKVKSTATPPKDAAVTVPESGSDNFDPLVYNSRQLFSQVSSAKRELEARMRMHVKFAQDNDRYARWTTLVLTFTTLASAISIFGNNVYVAAGFALVSAAISAINAGFNPPETAKTNREAALRYGRDIEPLSQLQVLSWPETVYRDGWYGDALVGQPLRDAWNKFATLQAEIQEAVAAAPLVEWQNAARDLDKEELARWEEQQSLWRVEQARWQEEGRPGNGDGTADADVSPPSVSTQTRG